MLENRACYVSFIDRFSRNEEELSQLHRLEGHQLGVISTDVDQSGSREFRGRGDHEAAAVALRRPTWSRSRSRSQCKRNCFASELASSSADASIRTWDLCSGEALQQFDSGPMDAWTVAFSPQTDATRLATGAVSGRILVYRLSDTGAHKETVLETSGTAKFILSLAYVSASNARLECACSPRCTATFPVRPESHRTSQNPIKPSGVKLVDIIAE